MVVRQNISLNDGVITGVAVPESHNTFLATKDVYSDFILELEVKIEGGLNSGIQFRSNFYPEYKDGRLHGYQAEVDPTVRAWSGGIFEEGRRGWLYKLTRNEACRKAFNQAEWNHYRIEAIGTVIRTWVNQVPCANLIDNMDNKGVIALQVHGIPKGQSATGKQASWRNIRILTENLEAHRTAMPADIYEYNAIPNQLSEKQKTDGWKLLWDGKTTKGWRGAKLSDFPEKGWEIDDGVLSVLASGGGESRNGGDIITEEEFYRI